jgi:hypothetical protein
MRKLISACIALALILLIAPSARALTAPVLSYDTVTQTSVHLTWTDGGNEQNYQVFKNSVLLTTLGNNVHSYTAINLTPDTTYAFRVNAKKGGTSLPSNTVNPRTLPPPPPPECSDGINNDPAEDTLIDFPADPGCTSTSDTTESPNPPPPRPVFRAFIDTSEWNKPLPTDASIIHPDSTAIITEIEGYDTTNEPRLSVGAWAEPIYWAQAADPTYTIDSLSFGPTLVDVHIPLGAQPTSTTDAQMTVYDMAKGTVFKLWHATWTGTTWTADGTEEYDLDSNGLSCTLPESDRVCPMNQGHRGYPTAIHAVRYDEVAAGVIPHVLKVALNHTASCSSYPGAGFESPWRGGTLTCEGLILRIDPSIDLAARGLTGGPLIIATAMQDYGVVIGDTGGTGMELKVENLAVEGRPETWADFGVTATSFVGKITFDDFVVVQAGYHRP